MKFRKMIAGAAAIVWVALLAGLPAAGQVRNSNSPAASTLPMLDGKPDFSGVWQTLNAAAWDIQDHSGQLDVPPGQGVVEGNEIPYTPAAAAKKKENYTNRATADPTQANCFLPGVPRATYMPYPFKIVQTPKQIAMI
jgi:hypothetical protein